jgi:D-3-phosphoglycerate dehydrogenase
VSGKPVVLVTPRSFSSGSFDARGALEKAGLDVVASGPDHQLSTIGSALHQATAWIAGTAPVTAEHLAHAPQLRIISRYGAGVDSVDLVAAGRRGVVVTNTPDANANAVADLAVALVLSALRDIPAGDRRVRVGDWSVRRSRELETSTVGIVGLGRIGRRVAARLQAFGSSIVGHDPWVPEDELRGLGIASAGLEEIGRQADVVTLHAPGGATIIDARWLGQVKPGLVLVNTARAALVDEDAIADALESGRLSCYATDTLSTESSAAGPHAPASPLLDARLAGSTIFSPHSGAQTIDAVDRMGRGAVDAVLEFLRGASPRNIVSPAPESGEPDQRIGDAAHDA